MLLKQKMKRVKDLYTRAQEKGIRVEVINLEKEIEGFHHEELYWRQRSMGDWFVSGDRNTKYFHVKTSSRKKKNALRRIQMGKGEWNETGNEIVRVLEEYFDGLFTSNHSSEKPYIGEEVFWAISNMKPT